MLPPVFEWLDLHPSIYWLIAAAGTVTLAASVATSRRKAWIFGGLLFLFLLAWRWPFLFCAAEYNPDESQFIAGAMALKHDPVFWRAVDGHTAGPLDFYALLPLHLLGVPLDYFCIRVTALLLTWLTLFLSLRLFRTFTTLLAAQLAVLPAAVFFACAIDADFIHYASELVPMALMALAVYWAGRRPVAAAFVAGCLPWAKLQAGPIGAVLFAWLLWQAWREPREVHLSIGRRWAMLAAGVLGPSLLALSALAAFGQLGHFFRRYVLQNIAYVGEGQSLGPVLRELTRHAEDDGQVPLWLAGAGLCLLGAGLGYTFKRQRPSSHFWLGAALLAAATGCILAPARTTLHYLLLLVVPVVVCTGVALADLWPHGRTRQAFVGLILVCTLVPLGWRLRQPVPSMFGQFAKHWRHPRTALGAVLRHWHLPGARLALWGWRSNVYVESGLAQATRDTVSMWCIEDTPQRDYYRATFLADVERNQPELFVDAVGQDSTAFKQRYTQGHETFPALAEYVRKHYILVTDLQGPRVYVRTDFLQRHPLPASTLEQLVTRGRMEYSKPVAPVTPAPIQSRVGDRIVQMIEPPAALHWLLDGTERSVQVRFGFHPRAYTEGHSDGAELIVELNPPGRPALQVYRRLLDPQHESADRGVQVAEVILPPFPAGAGLTVRTLPGKTGDSAWDWIYLDQLRFAHSPYYSPRQFPGFLRIPNQIEAAYPYLLGQDADWVLMLPPPVALTFVLDGRERQLNFAYGLAAGAYTGSGATDGAIYQVELHRAGAAPRPLFEHRLDPVGHVEQRGRQYASLALPADIQPGDRIVLRITAGATDSWDWTYIAALDLH